MHAQGGPGRAKPWLSYKVPGTLHTGHANRTGWAVSMGREECREDHLLSFPLHFLFLFSPLGTLLLIIYHGGHPLQLTIHNINFMLLKYRRISESSQQSHASSDKDSEQNGQHSPKKVSKGEKKHKHRLAGG